MKGLILYKLGFFFLKDFSFKDAELEAKYVSFQGHTCTLYIILNAHMSMGSCRSQKSCQNPRAGDTGPCESSIVDSGNQIEILHNSSIPKPSLQPHIQDLIVLVYIEFFFLRTTKLLFF